MEAAEVLSKLSIMNDKSSFVKVPGVITTVSQKRWMISLLLMKYRNHSSYGMKLMNAFSFHY
jgi:hypothetical protein